MTAKTHFFVPGAPSTHDELNKAGGVEPWHPEYARNGVKDGLEKVERDLASRINQWFKSFVTELTRDEVKKVNSGQVLPISDDKLWWWGYHGGKLDKVNSGQVLAALDDQIWWQFHSEELKKLLSQASVEAARLGQETASSQLGMTLSWDYLSPTVMDWAALNAAELVTAISDDIREQIRTQILTGLADGKTVFEIRDELANLKEDDGQKVFGQDRALRIARTEVIRAHTQGALQSYQQSGVVEKVQWLDGQSGACEKCQELNKTIKPAGEPFYEDPAFGDGFPPRHPNCRCAIAPVVTMTEPANGNE